MSWIRRLISVRDFLAPAAQYGSEALQKDLDSQKEVNVALQASNEVLKTDLNDQKQVNAALQASNEVLKTELDELKKAFENSPGFHPFIDQ